MNSLIDFLKDFFVSMWSNYPWLTVGLASILLSVSKIKLGGDIASIELISFPKKLRTFLFTIGLLLMLIEGILLIRFIDFSNTIKGNFNSLLKPFKQDIVYEFTEAPKELEVNELMSRYFDTNFLNNLYGDSYNLEEAKKYTTGNRYKQIEGCEKEECGFSVNWLKSKNAYLKFGFQKFKIVRQFISQKDKAFNVVVFVHGSFLFYQNRKPIKDQSELNSCKQNTYKLAKDGNNLKISELVDAFSVPCQ